MSVYRTLINRVSVWWNQHVEYLLACLVGWDDYTLDMLNRLHDEERIT